jgi:hypothetical protein
MGLDAGEAATCFVGGAAIRLGRDALVVLWAAFQQLPTASCAAAANQHTFAASKALPLAGHTLWVLPCRRREVGAICAGVRKQA